MAPEYLSYGMSLDEYWKGDPWLARTYYDAHVIRMKRQNTMMWYQGLYIHEAFSVVLANAFAAKGSQPKKYVSQPFPIYPKTEEELAAEEEMELQNMVASLNAWEKAFNAEYGENANK